MIIIDCVIAIIISITTIIMITIIVFINVFIVVIIIGVSSLLFSIYIELTVGIFGLPLFMGSLRPAPLL